MSGGTFTTIDVPGASDTVAYGINGSGQIVGRFWDGARGHGYLLSGGTFTTIDVLGASGTLASGINDFGQIVGRFSDVLPVTMFIRSSGGTFTTIDVPGAPTGPTGINVIGQIVGSFGKIYAWELDRPPRLSRQRRRGTNSTAAVDFDGDGRGDILWRHTSGAVGVWLTDGTSMSGAGSPGGAGPDWAIAAGVW